MQLARHSIGYEFKSPLRSFLFKLRMETAVFQSRKATCLLTRQLNKAACGKKFNEKCSGRIEPKAFPFTDCYSTQQATNINASVQGKTQNIMKPLKCMDFFHAQCWHIHRPPKKSSLPNVCTFIAPKKLVAHFLPNVSTFLAKCLHISCPMFAHLLPPKNGSFILFALQNSGKVVRFAAFKSGPLSLIV